MSLEAAAQAWRDSLPTLEQASQRMAAVARLAGGSLADMMANLDRLFPERSDRPRPSRASGGR